MEKSMLPAVIDIASKRLGDSFINEEILNYEISLCANIDQKIVGFCTAKVVNSQVMKNRFKDKKMKILDVCDEIGYIGSIAIDKDFEGRGIGTMLLNESIKKLSAKNINVIVMTAWKSNKGIHIQGIAENTGFKHEMEIAEYWKEDSIEHDYNCVECGKPPCRCSAVIFTKKIPVI